MKNTTWKPKTKLSKLLRHYGPVKLATQAEAWEMAQQDPFRILCTHISGDRWYGSIGYHIVDVMDRYILAKLAPAIIEYVYDVYFGDDGLPSE